MKFVERWNASTDAARFEAYTWWSLVLLMWMVPFFFVMTGLAHAPAGLAGAPGALVELPAEAGAVLLGVLGALHSAAVVRVTRDSFELRLGRGEPRRHSPTALAVTTVLTMAGGALVIPMSGTWPTSGGFLVTVALATAVGALGPRWTAPMLARAIAPAVAVVVVLHLPVPEIGGEHLVAAAAAATGIIGGYAFSVWLSAWMVQVVRRLEDAREVESRLAVAEERLRFARDLHDTLGRSLSAIAVKSQLAAELAHRGRPEAAAEMASVRDLAHQVLTEARSVAAGYRRVNLTDELEGARSLLRATGAVTSVTGDVTDISDAAQEVLAWAVQEGVTNVVRHSSARKVDLTIQAQNGMAVLALTNDAVTPGTATGGGSGLAGLAERVARVGGSLTTDQVGDRFTLRASVPAGLGPDPHGLASPDGPAQDRGTPSRARSASTQDSTRPDLDRREPTEDRAAVRAVADSGTTR